jgi:heme oxygenase
MKSLSESPTTSTSTNTSTTAPKTDCPYAVALHDGELVHSADSFGESLKQCPAFADDHSCPFKGASSQTDIQATFRQIPTSHYQMATFRNALQKLHAVDDSSTGFGIPGGCPVPAELKEQMSFRDAMEDLSLAAIMGRLAAAASLEDESEEGAADDGDNDARPVVVVKAVAVPAVSVAPTTTKRKSLSESLKSGTAVSHQAAEDVHFVRNFIRGEIDRGLYSKLIVGLYHVYDALEDALDAHAPQHFSSCHFPAQIQRRESLAEDMDFWNGTLAVPASPATVDYVERIRSIAAGDNPLLLLAHAYTRYLGDLSGGKVLARVACRALQLDRHTMEGLAFYQFEKIPSAKVFKDVYRQALDDLPLTALQIEGLVAEANVAFVLNMRLFEELDVHASVPGAKVRPLADALAYADPNIYKSAPAAATECPFLVKKNGSATAAAVPQKEARCPWPFVVFHDPAQFAKDWQTWLLMGLVLSLVWSQFV